MHILDCLFPIESPSKKLELRSFLANRLPQTGLVTGPLVAHRESTKSFTLLLAVPRPRIILPLSLSPLFWGMQGGVYSRGQSVSQPWEKRQMKDPPARGDVNRIEQALSALIGNGNDPYGLPWPGEETDVMTGGPVAVTDLVKDQHKVLVTARGPGHGLRFSCATLNS